MQINYNCELPREKFAVLFLICSWSGLTLFKWQESANPNSTTSFLIQFSFNGLIESPVLKCVKTSPKFALVLERIRTNWKYTLRKYTLGKYTLEKLNLYTLWVHFEKIHFGKIHRIGFGSEFSSRLKIFFVSEPNPIRFGQFYWIC